MERIVYTYTSILFIIFIMKSVGLDYFGISMSSPFILTLDKVFSNHYVYNLYGLIATTLYQHIMTSIIVKKKCYSLTLLSIIPTHIVQCYIVYLFPNFSIFIESLHLCTLCIIYNKINKTSNHIIRRTIFMVIINVLFQYISILTRSNYSFEYISSPSINIILNLDYTFLMILMYKIYFTKGDVKIWEIIEAEVGSSLQKLTLLRKQLKRFLTHFLNSSKKEKFETVLYFIFYLIWNVFTVLFVLFIAQLNHTFIECIFILTSFWSNKRIFGKEFHLKNALHCFILSNVTYYCLDRITTPASISLFVPILLGILLAYITSRFVKKDNKPLYRGMSEEELKEKLDRITNNQFDYRICKLFYVDRYSDLKIAMLEHYSLDGIKKRKKQINKKLNKLII